MAEQQTVLNRRKRDNKLRISEPAARADPELLGVSGPPVAMGGEVGPTRSPALGFP